MTNKRFIRAIASCVSVSFFFSSMTFPYISRAQSTGLPWIPASGVRVDLSPEFTPAYLKGMVIHPDNALQFDFLIHRGDAVLTKAQKQQEYKKLIKYFLASLAVPDQDQWVNLSPYEKSRIIKEDFGKTEMGRDLLAQDYILKQITASLIYPEENLGKRFWDKVYAEVYQQYGTTSIRVDTFNKVWIVPDEAYIYEHGNMVYIVKQHLKVMLEEDYLALSKHSALNSVIARSPQGDEAILKGIASPRQGGARNDTNKAHALASQVVREIILPQLEREVNQGKNFATLRQVYSGMLLAAWFKRALKESLLGKVYADRDKVKGVEPSVSLRGSGSDRSNLLNSKKIASPSARNDTDIEYIYQQYLKAFKKGVFNYIKEDVDKYTNEPIPRKYFSGGTLGYTPEIYNQNVKPADPSMVASDLAMNLRALDDTRADLKQAAVPAGPATTVPDAARTSDTAMMTVTVNFNKEKEIWDIVIGDKIIHADKGLNDLAEQLKQALGEGISISIEDAWLNIHVPMLTYSYRVNAEDSTQLKNTIEEVISNLQQEYKKVSDNDLVSLYYSVQNFLKENPHDLSSVTAFLTDKERDRLTIFLNVVYSKRDPTLGTEETILTQALRDWYRESGHLLHPRTNTPFYILLRYIMANAKRRQKEFQQGQQTLQNFPVFVRRIIARVVYGQGHFETISKVDSIFLNFVTRTHPDSTGRISSKIIGPIKAEISQGETSLITPEEVDSAFEILKPLIIEELQKDQYKRQALQEKIFFQSSEFFDTVKENYGDLAVNQKGSIVWVRYKNYRNPINLISDVINLLKREKIIFGTFAIRRDGTWRINLATSKDETLSELEQHKEWLEDLLNQLKQNKIPFTPDAIKEQAEKIVREINLLLFASVKDLSDQALKKMSPELFFARKGSPQESTDYVLGQKKYMTGVVLPEDGLKPSLNRLRFSSETKNKIINSYRKLGYFIPEVKKPEIDVKDDDIDFDQAMVANPQADTAMTANPQVGPPDHAMVSKRKIAMGIVAAAALFIAAVSTIHKSSSRTDWHTFKSLKLPFVDKKLYTVNPTEGDILNDDMRQKLQSGNPEFVSSVLNNPRVLHQLVEKSLNLSSNLMTLGSIASKGTFPNIQLHYNYIPPRYPFVIRWKGNIPVVTTTGTEEARQKVYENITLFLYYASSYPHINPRTADKIFNSGAVSENARLELFRNPGLSQWALGKLQQYSSLDMDFIEALLTNPATPEKDIGRLFDTHKNAIYQRKDVLLFATLAKSTNTPPYILREFVKRYSPKKAKSLHIPVYLTEEWARWAEENLEKRGYKVDGAKQEQEKLKSLLNLNVPKIFEPDRPTTPKFLTPKQAEEVLAKGGIDFNAANLNLPANRAEKNPDAAMTTNLVKVDRDALQGEGQLRSQIERMSPLEYAQWLSVRENAIKIFGRPIDQITEKDLYREIIQRPLFRGLEGRATEKGIYRAIDHRKSLLKALGLSSDAFDGGKNQDRPWMGANFGNYHGEKTPTGARLKGYISFKDWEKDFTPERLMKFRMELRMADVKGDLKIQTPLASMATAIIRRLEDIVFYSDRKKDILTVLKTAKRIFGDDRVKTYTGVDFSGSSFNQMVASSVKKSLETGTIFNLPERLNVPEFTEFLNSGDAAMTAVTASDVAKFKNARLPPVDESDPNSFLVSQRQLIGDSKPGEVLNKAAVGVLNNEVKRTHQPVDKLLQDPEEVKYMIDTIREFSITSALRQQIKSSSSSFDQALATTPGGIDLNAANLNLQIKRDGRGVPLPLAQQNMDQLMQIQGFVPVIIEIKPAANLPILSELQEAVSSKT